MDAHTDLLTTEELGARLKSSRATVSAWTEWGALAAGTDNIQPCGIARLPQGVGPLETRVKA